MLRVLEPPRLTRGAQGFTLLELMAVVAVIAITLTLGVPSFISIINGNRLTAQANELVAALQIARSEAIRSNRPVRLCRTENGTSCASAGRWNRWIVLSAANEVLRDASSRSPVQISSGQSEIVYAANGLARASAGGLLTNTFTVCIPASRPEQNRRLVQLAAGSRVSISSDGDGDATCP